MKCGFKLTILTSQINLLFSMIILFTDGCFPVAADHWETVIPCLPRLPKILVLLKYLVIVHISIFPIQTKKLEKSKNET